MFKNQEKIIFDNKIEISPVMGIIFILLMPIKSFVMSKENHLMQESFIINLLNICLKIKKKSFLIIKLK